MDARGHGGPEGLPAPAAGPRLTPWILLWLAAINLATWYGFARDKHAAVYGKRRTPERNLLVLAALGGSPAAFAARRILRHKIRKEPFGTRLLIVACLQVVIVAPAIALAAGWIG